MWFANKVVRSVPWNTMNIHEAAKDGNVKATNSAIERIYDEITDPIGRVQALYAKDAYHLTPLHYAVKYNHIEVVHLLIDCKADVNAKGERGVTPLHYATRYMRLEEDCSILQLLILNNADVNIRDDFGSSPLHYACLKGNSKAVKNLLRTGKSLVNGVDHLDSTPLHSACSNGSIDIVDMLVEEHADIVAADEGGSTPLHIACAQGHEELLKHLLRIAEEKNGPESIPVLIIKQNNEGQSLFHLAVLGSYVNIAVILLEKGTDVNLCMEGEETALHIAAVTGNREIVRLLLMHGVEVDRENMIGRTALHKAARFGKHRIVEMLLNKGANVNCIDRYHFTPLILASSISGNAKTILILIKYGAKLKLTDKEDESALHMAVLDNHINGVRTLLTTKDVSDIIDFPNKDNNTALHIACKNGFEEIAIMLMDANADVQCRNNSEQTPLHLAAFFGQDDLVDNILEINPSAINDLDREGNSPLHLAAQRGHTDVIKYLLKKGASINDKNTENMTPLNCAAKNGQSGAVSALIWGGASVSPQVESGLGPLHFSCLEGSADTTDILLKYCDIGHTDANGRNPLDICIDNYKKDAAITLLNHRDWKVALRNKTIESSHVVTPLRKMIKRMPDIAIHTFNRCITECEEFPSDHAEYNITLNYEFLDDTYNDWHCDVVRKDTKEGKGKGDVYTSSTIQKEMESKDSHTLSWMVRNKRQDLLGHPLSMSLLGRKWLQFATFIYYFKLILYTIFLVFLTGYILTSAPLRKPYRADDCSIKIDRGKWDMFLFIYVGKYIVVILALSHMVFEVFQIVGQRLGYLALDNLLEWSVFILAILNVIDDFLHLPILDNLANGGVVCGGYQKAVGALCIFLGWFNFVLFIQKVPVFGIYIVMFLFVISTFMKFFVVFVFLIVGFGFSFYLLFHDFEDLPAFHNPFTALVKTVVMMTGEMNFDDLFFLHGNNGEPFKAVTWALFGIFIVIMVIVLMNLLVGLAVDDIQEVQKQAEMTKATMQIEICLDAERILPTAIRKKFIVATQTIYPNKTGLPTNITVDIFADIQEVIKNKKADDDQITDNLKVLQDNVVSMDLKLKEIDYQLSEMGEFNQMMTELKTMMAEILKYQKRRSSRKKPTDDDSKDDVL